MKQLIIFILLLAAFTVHAQEDTTHYFKYPKTYGIQYPRLWATGVLRTPYKDTSALCPLPGAIQSGLDGNPYWWNGVKWSPLNSASGLDSYVKFSDSLTKYVTPAQFNAYTWERSLDALDGTGNLLTENHEINAQGHAFGINNAIPFYVDNYWEDSLETLLYIDNPNFGASLYAKHYFPSNQFGHQESHGVDVRPDSAYFGTYYTIADTPNNLHDRRYAVVSNTSEIKMVAEFPFAGTGSDINLKPDSITISSPKIILNAGAVTSADSILGFDPVNINKLVKVPSSAITSAFPWNKITNTPTTLSGYGITDAYPLTGNPSGFLTGINSSDVTSALGYTPVTNNRTITINGISHNLSSDASWTVSGGDSYSTTAPLTINDTTITRRWNVVDYGADTTGVNDASAAIQAAINACFANGGGTVFFPNGTYLVADTLQTNIGGYNMNSQIYIPYSSYDTTRTHIIIEGESAPNLTFGSDGVTTIPAPKKGVIIKSTLTSGATNAAVIGTGAPSSQFNYNYLTVKNIAILVKSNPAGAGPVVGGISYKRGASLITDHVLVSIDTTTAASVVPTNDVAGIETPDINSETYNLIQTTLVNGFRNGYTFGEHVVFNQAQAFICYHGFTVKNGAHNSTALRTTAQWCRDALFASGATPLDNFHLDVEFVTGTSGWYKSVYFVNDSLNQLHGTLYFTSPQSTTAVNNGASYLNIYSYDANFPLSEKSASYQWYLHASTGNNAYMRMQYGSGGNQAAIFFANSGGSNIYSLGYGYAGDNSDFFINDQAHGHLTMRIYNSDIFLGGNALSSPLLTMKYSTSQLGINNSSPDASAVLDIASTTKGFLPPRMSGAQMEAVASPATGLVVYCTDSSALCTYNGSAWRKLATSVAATYTAGRGLNLSDNSFSLDTSKNYTWNSQYINGSLSIGTTSPTHTLTLSSTATGIASYNTTDQTTNYERVVGQWTGNVYSIGSYYAGTGTSARSLQLGLCTNAGSTDLTSTATRTFTINSSASSSKGVFDLNINGTSVTGNQFTIQGTGNASSNSQNWVSIQPTYNQSGTAGYSALLISPYEQGTGSGNKYLINAGTSSSASGGGTFSQKFAVTNAGVTTASQYRLSALNTAPSSAADAGTAGEVRITASYIYVCVAANTWVRAALSTW